MDISLLLRWKEGNPREITPGELSSQIDATKFVVRAWAFDNQSVTVHNRFNIGAAGGVSTEFADTINGPWSTTLTDATRFARFGGVTIVNYTRAGAMGWPVAMDDKHYVLYTKTLSPVDIVSLTTPGSLEHFYTNFNRYVYSSVTNKLTELTDIEANTFSKPLDMSYEQDRSFIKPNALLSAINNGGTVGIYEPAKTISRIFDNTKYVFWLSSTLTLTRGYFYDGLTITFVKMTDQPITITTDTKSAGFDGNSYDMTISRSVMNAIRNTETEKYGSITLEYYQDNFYVVSASGRWEFFDILA